MSLAHVEAAFGDAGFTSADAASRTALVERAMVAFSQAHERRPHWAWFVPGRVEVFGKHTDYAGGRSLVAAVPRGFALVAAPRQDRLVAVSDARWGDRVELAIDDAGTRPKGWGNYVATVVHRLALNFPGASLGLNLTMASDLPRAAGLSSSSALVVGLGLAMAERAGLRQRAEWTDSIQTTLDLAGYLGAVENGLTFRALAGTSGVGTHGGSEDHSAILASAAEKVAAFSYLPVRLAGRATMPADWRFVVMTSGVHADKAGSVKGRYNRAALAARALADAWVFHGGAPGTLAHVLAAPGAADELRAVVKSGHEGFTGEDLERRLTHFTREDARVPLALDAFARADQDQLGELSDASQLDADTLLGNQIPETVHLAAAARAAGAFAASSFGAGFGGSVWALCEAADVNRFVESWHRRYRSAAPGGRPLEWFAARPGPAAVAIDLTGRRSDP